MASRRTEQAIGGRVVHEEEEDELAVGADDSDGDDEVVEVRRRVSCFTIEGDDGGEAAGELRRRRRASRFAVEGGDACVGVDSRGVQHDRRRDGCVGAGGRTLPPPHAWLAVEDTKKISCGSDTEEQWARLLRGQAEASSQPRPRRSSFSVVRQERGAREAWLNRAWEMKKSWHERSGGAPDADTPVVVVVGKGGGPSSPSCSSPHTAGPHAAAGVAMDMEEVRACRDLGLELPSDRTVEIQCYGLSAGSNPTRSLTTTSSSGTDSPSCSSPGAGEDPVNMKARLKVWAQAVALASTTHLGS